MRCCSGTKTRYVTCCPPPAHPHPVATVLYVGCAATLSVTSPGCSLASHVQQFNPTLYLMRQAQAASDRLHDVFLLQPKVFHMITESTMKLLATLRHEEENLLQQSNHR